MPDITTLRIEYSGVSRLGVEQCAELAATARAWARSSPPALLVDVVGDAWDQTPVVSVDRDLVTSGFQAAVRAVLDIPCPVVVALDGRVTGVGLALALAADVQYATERTTIAIGDGTPVAALLGGASWLVAQLCGGGTFAQLAWLGGSLTSQEAVARGLLTAVGPTADARERAGVLARDSVGWSALKRALRSRERSQFSTVLRYQAWLADVASDAASAVAKAPQSSTR
jgi:enoyl-CoA hydratase/carnithine racemase